VLERTADAFADVSVPADLNGSTVEVRRPVGGTIAEGVVEDGTVSVPPCYAGADVEVHPVGEIPA